MTASGFGNQFTLRDLIINFCGAAYTNISQSPVPLDQAAQALWRASKPGIFKSPVSSESDVILTKVLHFIMPGMILKDLLRLGSIMSQALKTLLLRIARPPHCVALV